MQGTDTATEWYSDDTATFGDRVAAAREHLGMSEEDLARRLGIKLETLRKWENDTAEPRANKLQMLSGVLNVSLRWLLTGVGVEFDGPPAGEIDAEVSEILRDMRSVRSDMARSLEKMGILEKRLRAAVRTVDA